MDELRPPGTGVASVHDVGMQTGMGHTTTVGVWVSATDLRSEVERAAAASGVGLLRTGTGTGTGTGRGAQGGGAAPAEGEWARCDLIVLDVQAADAAARAGMPRRPGVVVVVGDPDDADDADDANDADATDDAGDAGGVNNGIVRSAAPQGERAGDGGIGVSAARHGVAVWQRAVTLGAEHVLALPSEASTLMSVLSRPTAGAEGGGVIAVVSGHGGAGASVLASALALTAPLPSLLVDLDPAGAGLDLLLGIEGREGLRWPQLRLRDGRVDPESLRRGLPRRGRTTVLAAGPVAGLGDGAGRYQVGSEADGADEFAGAVGFAAVAPAGLVRCGEVERSWPEPRAVRSVTQVGRDGGMSVVADISGSWTAAAAAAVEVADMTVLVTRADVPGCSAAVRALGWLRGHTDRTALVVRGPAPGGLRPADVENALGIPLLTSMRAEPGLAKRMEHGGVSFARNSPLERAAMAVHRVHERRPRPGWEGTRPMAQKGMGGA